MPGIRDAVVVITGASSGIGRATALEFARSGATVVVAARRAEEIRELAAVCRDLAGLSLAVPTDVTRNEEVKALAERAVETFGRIDVWVNNAGVAMFGRFEETPEQVWRGVIETNLFGSVHGARAVLPIFREQGRGVLIEVSSVLGKVGAPYWSAYVASKYAIAGFSESLRDEVRRGGIRVCTIFPSIVDTPIYQNAANFSGQAVKPPEPISDPREVARAIVHLARHPRRELYVGTAARSLVWMRRLLGNLGERIVTRRVERRQFRDWPALPSTGNVFAPARTRGALTGGWTSERQRRWPRYLRTTLLAAGGTAGAALLLRREARWLRRIPLLGGAR